MAQSDIFVHPARYPDACPTSLIEATALGLPIIASNLGGIPEIVVNGKGGLLFKSNSSKDLAAKLGSLIQDESLRTKFRDFNIRWSREFDISSIGPRVVRIYNDAISRESIRKRTLNQTQDKVEKFSA
jgi:glycosyltransferase involved in cell wall biosynthesis